MNDNSSPEQELRELAYPAVLDAAEEHEQACIDAALAAGGGAADRLAEEVRELRETVAAMTVFDRVDPPPALEAAILRAVDRERADRRRAAPPRRAVLLSAAAATAVVALGIGVAVWRDHTGQPGPSQLVLSQDDLRTVTGPVGPGGRVTAHLSARLARAVVSFDGVAPPPASRAYQLWLLPTGGAPTSAALLTALPGADGVVFDIDGAAAIGMTVEPAAGSARPTTTPIAVLRLR